MKWWGIIISLATMGMGVAFPAYKSVEAVESEGVLDDTQWLTYWLVAAFMTIFERFAYKVLFRIPLYGETKLLLICWLVLPMTSGAKALYDIARPYIIDLYHAVNNSAEELKSDDPNIKKISDARKHVSEVKLGMQKTVDKLLLDATTSGDTSRLDEKLEEYRSLNA